MRWNWLTPAQKKDQKALRMVQWTRHFAFWPKYDSASQTAYWLEFVWRRSKPRPCASVRPWWIHEYRGGKDAPELKQKDAQP